MSAPSLSAGSPARGRRARGAGPRRGLRPAGAALLRAARRGAAMRSCAVAVTEAPARARSWSAPGARWSPPRAASTPRRSPTSTTRCSSASASRRSSSTARTTWPASSTSKPLVDAAQRPGGSSAWSAPRTVGETEDHIACLCEVMRYLIAGDDVGVSNLGAQQRFFNAHLRPWVERVVRRHRRRIRAQTSIAPLAGVQPRFLRGRGAGASTCSMPEPSFAPMQSGCITRLTHLQAYCIDSQ